MINTRRKLSWRRRRRRDGEKTRRAGQKTKEADQLQKTKLLLTNKHQSGTFEECIKRNQNGKEEERTEEGEKRPKMTNGETKRTASEKNGESFY